MARPKIRKAPKNIVERNIALTGELMRYLFEHPALFDALPDNFELVILPENDPEMRLYNLELLDTYADADKPIVFARLKSEYGRTLTELRPSLYVPVAA